MLGDSNLLLHSNCPIPISVVHFDINRILILNRTHVYHNNNNDSDSDSSDNDKNDNNNNNNNNNNISLNRYTVLHSQRKYRIYSAKIACFSFLIRENIVLILLIKYPYIAMVANGNFLSNKFGKKDLAGNTDLKNSLNRKRRGILRNSLQQKDPFAWFLVAA